MKSIITAERVSRDASDNFVFQRSLLAYYEAKERVEGDVLEIGTGTGYGIEVIAPSTIRFTTIDKHIEPHLREIESKIKGVEIKESTVPPLPFADSSFDCVISFQVIEHIKDDKRFIEEVKRVLRPGGRFIVSTPNKEMSLTRNPWHIREYTLEEFRRLLSESFNDVEALGVEGNERIMEYYEKNREGVRSITKFDILNLQYRLPRWMLQIPYDILNRINRKRLLKRNNDLTRSIKMDDYRLCPAHPKCFDWFFIATK